MLQLCDGKGDLFTAKEAKVFAKNVESSNLRKSDWGITKCEFGLKSLDAGTPVGRFA